MIPAGDLPVKDDAVVLSHHPGHRVHVEHDVNAVRGRRIPRLDVDDGAGVALRSDEVQPTPKGGGLPPKGERILVLREDSVAHPGPPSAGSTR